ncbi:MAG: hypothetical protein N2572_03895 [Syntrophales bacterium]|nr:hypothetical protein [Syntrophales bacterium]
MGRLTVKWMALAVIIAIFSLLAWSWAKEEIRKNKDLLTSKEKAYSEFNQLYREYRQTKDLEIKVKQLIAQRPRDFNLNAWVERKLAHLGIKGNVKSIPPDKLSSYGGLHGVGVVVELEGVTLKQLIEILNQIDQPGEMVYVTSVSVGANRDRAGYLNVGMDLFTWVEK